jgi:hypothetical protein
VDDRTDPYRWYCRLYRKGCLTMSHVSVVACLDDTDGMLARAARIAADGRSDFVRKAVEQGWKACSPRGTRKASTGKAAAAWA